MRAGDKGSEKARPSRASVTLRQGGKVSSPEHGCDPEAEDLLAQRRLRFVCANREPVIQRRSILR